MTIRRNDYVGDFEWVFIATSAIFILIALLFIAIGAGIDGNIDANVRSYEEYSEFAEKANENFSPEQREMLVEIMPEYEDDLGEDGLFAEREAPQTTSFGQFVERNGWFFVLLFVAISSLASTIFYALAHDNIYYFADLPFKSFHGWFVLVTSFAVAWPFFIVSRILFWRFKKNENTVSLPEISTVFNENEFITFCQSRSPLNKRIEKAKKKLKESEQKVKYCGEEIKAHTEHLKTYQREVSQRQADLNDLINQTKDASNDSREAEQLAHDFEEIKAMRGVKQIFMNTAGDLVVTVRAEYEYAGLLYDLGDFDITISDNSIDVYRTRTSSSNYHYGRTFCLGQNRDTIISYANEDRIVEAIELAIESINHINDSDLDSVPQRYKVIKSKKT